MKLKVFWTDMRGGWVDPVEVNNDVIDEETGAVVGYTIAARSPIERHVFLFGEEYTGIFQTYEECKTFVKGVEAVLTHLTST